MAKLVAPAWAELLLESARSAEHFGVEQLRRACNPRGGYNGSRIESVRSGDFEFLFSADRRIRKKTRGRVVIRNDPQNVFGLGIWSGSAGDVPCMYSSDSFGRRK
jgi:hypothetical protein